MTAEILRVADGQVRCGRCHTQFDALERLLEEGDAHAAESGRFLQTPPQPSPQSEEPIEAEPIDVDEPDSMEEITLEGRHIEISGTYRMIESESGEVQTRRETFEEWAEVNDEDQPLSEEEQEEEEEEEARQGRVEDTAPEEADLQPPLPPSVPTHLQRPTRAPLGARRLPEERVEPDPIDDLPIFVAPARPRSAVGWKIAAAPLALLLVVQVIHHHRSDLARHPRFGAPLVSAYQALGLQLTPDWDLHAYGVKQWGVVMDSSSPGTLIVRASITNNAAFAQPQPLLRLVLEDRWGDQVRAREFEPVEYLDAGTAPQRLLDPGQQTNATISIVDPGPDAEGFRFDVCLPGRSGPVCASEVPKLAGT